MAPFDQWHITRESDSRTPVMWAQNGAYAAAGLRLPLKGRFAARCSTTGVAVGPGASCAEPSPTR